ncbi:unnamed protein product [Amaranthus hypochondriacus]
MGRERKFSEKGSGFFKSHNTTVHGIRRDTAISNSSGKFLSPGTASFGRWMVKKTPLNSDRHGGGRGLSKSGQVHDSSGGKFGEEDEWTIVKRKYHGEKNHSTNNRIFKSSSPTSRFGHRGLSRHQWWRGPREPPRIRLGEVSLFVDGVARALSISELRATFEKYGEVTDVYIAGKKRKNKSVGFAFIKFKRKEEASKAIENINGVSLKGCKLAVSIAKYTRNPSSLIGKEKETQKMVTKNRVPKPALRDHRQYADVVKRNNLKNSIALDKFDCLKVENLPLGISDDWFGDLFMEVGRVEFAYISKDQSAERSSEVGWVKFQRQMDAVTAFDRFNGFVIKGRKIRITKVCSESLKYVPPHPTQEKVAPQVIPNITVNNDIVSRLANAIVVNVENIVDGNDVTDILVANDLPFVCLSSLSPKEFIIFMENDVEVNRALERNSLFWDLFVGVRKWKNGMHFMDRLTWLECIGIPPNFWSVENVRKIGEKWGMVLQVDYKYHGLNSITAAKILVQTKQQKIIDEKIPLVCEGHSYLMWVHETHVCSCEHKKQIDYVDVEVDSVDFDDEQDDRAAVNGNQVVIPANGVKGREENMEILGDFNRNEFEGEVSGNDMVEQIEEHLAKVTSATVSKPNCQVLLDSEPIDMSQICGRQVQHYYSESFDPMEHVEVQAIHCVTNTQPSLRRKARGRPKRIACSLPDPLLVQSTPLRSGSEADVTWTVARNIGVKTTREGITMEELRKSKRVMARVEKNATGAA